MKDTGAEKVRWERRFSKRVGYRRSGLYGLASKTPNHSTHTMNLSGTGLFLTASHVFELGTKLDITIRENEQYLKLEGIVTRIVQKEESTIFNSDCGMGIRFINKNQELLNIYNNEKSLTTLS